MVELNPFLFYISLGAILIIAEVLIFNLSVFWFLFVGIGAVVAALIAWLFPDTSWLTATSAFVVASSLISLMCYKPLKRWQQKPGAMSGNDAIGQLVDVIATITPENLGTVNWSGATWSAKLVEGSETLDKGDVAEISAVNGIVLSVKKSQS